MWATFTLKKADLGVYSREEREKVVRQVCVSVLRTKERHRGDLLTSIYSELEYVPGVI